MQQMLEKLTFTVGHPLPAERLLMPTCIFNWDRREKFFFQQIKAGMEVAGATEGGW